MIQRRTRLVHVLYGAAFLLALIIRLAGINRLPLTDSEANLALQALAVARGEDVQLGPHPAYLILTTFLMFLFSAGNWAARFWPALAGSLLVLVPAMFQRPLGKLPAVILAFLLALDPAMLGVSVQVGSVPLALLFLMLAAGLLLARREASAGIATGMALLSGPSLWPGVFSLAIAIWAAGRFRRLQALTGDGPVQARPTPWTAGGFNVRRAAVFALMTVFFTGTLFFFVPRGLSALGASLPAYLSGWSAPSGVPASLLLTALLTYEFLLLIFGLVGAVVGLVRGNPVDRFLVIWWAVAFILPLVYPGRQLADLAWSILPLAALAARQLARMVRAPAIDRAPAIGQALLSAVILGFVSMTLLSMVNLSPAGGQREHIVRLAGALVMLFASTGLIAWGWSSRVALRGLAWGATAVVVLYAVSAAWNAAGLSNRDGAELWAGGKRLPDAPLFLKTLDDLRQWGPVVSGGPDLVVVEVDSPALRWSLRGFNKISYVNRLPEDASPAFVITPEQPELALSATYRGQDFILSEDPGWNSFRPDQWLRWLAFRAIPAESVRQERLILWARTDLFPGGDVEPEAPVDEAVQPPEDAR